MVTLVRKKNSRFSVSMTESDYRRLNRIAKAHRPQLSLQYLVGWALKGLIDRAEYPQLYLELGNPVEKNFR